MTERFRARDETEEPDSARAVSVGGVAGLVPRRASESRLPEH